MSLRSATLGVVVTGELLEVDLIENLRNLRFAERCMFADSGQRDSIARFDEHEGGVAVLDQRRDVGFELSLLEFEREAVERALVSVVGQT
jgi:hypothetical protein